MVRRLSGIARNVEFTDPSLVGRFFGRNLLLFSLVLDEDQTKELRKSFEQPIAPVRLESFSRTPMFEGQRVTCYAHFNKRDQMFDCVTLVAHESGSFIGAVRRLNIYLAVVAIICYLLVVGLVPVGIAGMLDAVQSGSLSVLVGLPVALAMVLAYSAIVVVGAVYLAVVAIPTVWQAIYNLTRSLTHYGPSNHHESEHGCTDTESSSKANPPVVIQ